MALRVVVAEDNLLGPRGHYQAARAPGRASTSCGVCGDLRRTARDGRRRSRPTWSSPTSACRRPAPTRASAPRWRCGLAPRRRRRRARQYVEPAYALALLERGSEGRGVPAKERVSDAGQIVHAIEEVARGGSVIDPMVVEALGRRSARVGVAARTAHATRARGARADGAGEEQRRASPRPCSSRNGRSRNTSTRCSPSSGSPRSPTSTAGSKRCCCTSPGRGASTPTASGRVHPGPASARRGR